MFFIASIVPIEKNHSRLVIDPFIKLCESNAFQFNSLVILLKLNDLKTIVIKLRGTREYSSFFSDYALLMEKALESLDNSVAFIESAKINLGFIKQKADK